MGKRDRLQERLHKRRQRARQRERRTEASGLTSSETAGYSRQSVEAQLSIDSEAGQVVVDSWVAESLGYGTPEWKRRYRRDQRGGLMPGVWRLEGGTIPRWVLNWNAADSYVAEVGSAENNREARGRRRRAAGPPRAL